MALIGEVGVKQMHKMGEELCGDTVEVIYKEDGVVIVLSDGLGSGVKANILSSLTAKIASKMISENVPVDEVVATVVGTLPICSERGVAYSTFTIIRLYNNGVVHLADFDGCDVIRISKDDIAPINRTQRTTNGRTINEANFKMNEGEALVAVSDGVMQAGLGGLLPNGLGTDGLVDVLERFVELDDSVASIAEKIVNICDSFYIQQPEDDTTAIVLRLVQEKRLVLMTGPPSEKFMDSQFVTRFLELPGKKIISGGTTAQIFSRRTGKQLRVSVVAISAGLPPQAYIEGVDLVTEGVITMTEAERKLADKETLGDDPASQLAAMLLEAHHITILQGMRINPAYKGDRITGLNLREVVVEKMTKTLQSYGKKVKVEQF